MVQLSSATKNICMQELFSVLVTTILEQINYINLLSDTE